MAQFRNDVEKKKVLTWARELWETFEVFDALRDEYSYVDDVMKAAYVPDSVFVRECLIGCYECDFERFPKQVDADLQDVASGLGVKMVEDTHRTLGIKAKQNYNDNLSRHARWGVAIHSGIVEANDRTNCKADDETRLSSKKDTLKLDDYKPKASKFSLGEDCYKQLLTKEDSIIWRFRRDRIDFVNCFGFLQYVFFFYL
jgi:hypothetical protein